ncbi:hypothetical protein AV530_010535 [Patagioenas fasciata monilis]|uniref:Uncharacterized protein n=1 Tax=Patagioenas fasciata monilis TaxID=372326 RepID=A0A1V4KFD7_PATFA|nr:hypothetical protein AV530_010535 [Patagioenas fasciata monilis]
MVEWASLRGLKTRNDGGVIYLLLGQSNSKMGNSVSDHRQVAELLKTISMNQAPAHKRDWFWTISIQSGHICKLFFNQGC